MPTRATIRDDSYVEMSFDTPRPAGDGVTFSVYLDEETSPNVYTPVDFTGQAFLCHVKRDLKSVDPDGTFTVTPRGGGPDAGWLDFVMLSSVSTLLGEGDFYISMKMWPTADPEAKRTLIVGVLPLRWFATR